jgi:hypothetical protein
LLGSKLRESERPIQLLVPMLELWQQVLVLVPDHAISKTEAAPATGAARQAVA